jgi:hypothetical protein
MARYSGSFDVLDAKWNIPQAEIWNSAGSGYPRLVEVGFLTGQVALGYSPDFLMIRSTTMGVGPFYPQTIPPEDPNEPNGNTRVECNGWITAPVVDLGAPLMRFSGYYGLGTGAIYQFPRGITYSNTSSLVLVPTYFNYWHTLNISVEE